jgi:aminomethyltransferase
MGGMTLTRTTFDAVQRRIPGAEFAAWEGWDWIAGFGNAHAEHRAVRTACGVWDESPLQKWVLDGPDALVAADRCFTNDMRSLRPGQLRYGAFCDDDGRMLGDGTVFAFAPDRCWVVTALWSDGEALQEAAAGLEVALTNHTRELPHLQLQGPRSRGLLERLGGLDLSGLGYYRFLTEPVDLAGVPVTLARCGYSGELGYELYVSPDAAEALWEVLIGSGQVTPYGLNAVETLRQESGLIFIDADYFPGDTDPYEMNLDHVIRLEKPAFRGQEALRRIAAAPARRLTTVTVSGDRPAVPGGEVRSGGEPVGEVRSACWSPTLERLIAMVVIDASLIGPGARFDVELEPGGTAPGVIGDHPIYDTHKLRPRA